MREALRRRSSRGALLQSLLAVIVSGCTASDRVDDTALPSLADHPLYRTYDFGSSADIVDIGIQPLWIPTSLVAEMMRHDRILAAQLGERDVKLRFHAFLKGADVNFFLERGDLEVGIGGDMPALTAAARAGVLVTTLIQQGMCSIVAPHQMLLSDLRGKRVGYAFGSNAHYALLDSLRLAGLSEEDVRMVPMDVNRMPRALDRGEIAAFSAWEPTPTIAAAQYPGQVAIHRSLCTGYLYFAGPFAAGNHRTVVQIVATALRGLHQLQTSSDAIVLARKWASKSAAALDTDVQVLSASQIENLARQDILGVSGLPTIPAAMLADGGSLHRELEFLKELGSIPTTTRWQTLRERFDPSIANAVIAAAGEHRLFDDGIAAAPR